MAAVTSTPKSALANIIEAEFTRPEGNGTIRPTMPVQDLPSHVKDAKKSAGSGKEMSSNRTSSTTLVRDQLLSTAQKSGSELTTLTPDAIVEVLDPASPDFDVYQWAKTILTAADRAKVRFRRASVAFEHLDVLGSGSATNLQPTVASVGFAAFRPQRLMSLGKKSDNKILDSFDGLVKSGEMLLVLGRPGSGCSTFLKTIAGELNGLTLSQKSKLHYNGVPQERMIANFKGELVYNAEVDRHFPHLTVGETLEFAAALRTPSNHVVAVSRKDNIQQVVAVVMTVCGLTHTKNTKVGNDFVRGVSGGERKRVSIAEMMLASSPIGCWDNSTRGLDAATALQFVQALKTTSEILGTTHAVAIYQASQAIFDVFDKVILLYQGEEIYFGSTHAAKPYFEEMGWYCPPRQTTGDFLTSVTNHLERKPREGYQLRVPRTPTEFVQYWHASEEYKALQLQLEYHNNDATTHIAADEFTASHQAAQSHHIRSQSPYTVSIPMQLKICLRRAYQRLWNDKASTLTVVIGQIIMALVVGSVFYGTPDNTNSFFAKGSTLFFATLLNALIAVTEINSLYQQRPIVEKQASYAFCHPFTEAFAGVISDVPVKLIIAICFNLIIYFLAGLRPEPSQFFIFFLFTVLVRFTMSAMFRTVAAVTKTVSQALAIAGVLVLVIVIYTGYTVPRPYMHPWFKWLSWINPLAYAFEALMVNEFHGRDFACADFVPTYPNLVGETFICSVAGAISGQTTVSGDLYVQASFQYSYSHIWRNFGIVLGFYLSFLVIYLVATELNSTTSSAAEVLVFRKKLKLPILRDAGDCAHNEDAPSGKQRASSMCSGSRKSEHDTLQAQKDVFTWRDVVYDIHIKDQPRRLLDHVSGWVKPGTLTALMGVSGAGKTTLLDVLAQRTFVGVVSGDMLVNGKPLDSSFQRKTGYVQQQDLHLETSTVREALRFSAMLRQPGTVSTKDKYSHVEDVVKMLEMEDFSEAIIGVPGQGLNVEQRKLLTIGVELAAKPALLIFLDEPTSGLDSQSSWAIIGFLRKLANNGQAVLATIHQPSAVLFEEFDQLLFLAKGGRTVYFGDIGHNSQTLLNYFENNGARPCGDSENPAEYILETVTAGVDGKSGHSWPEIWNSSNEFQNVRIEQDRIHNAMSNVRVGSKGDTEHNEFAMPLKSQLVHTTIRIFQQYWRTPSYIWGKFLLALVSALFIGFSFFQSNNSLQGLQNVVFSVFMLTSILSSLVQQIMPRFVLQRSLYEVRERPSKTYSWVAFIIANCLVEIPYQVFLGILVFVCYYYPTFGIQTSERQALIMLFCIQIFVFCSTFAHMVIVALPDSQTAGAVATLLFSLTMIFNGVFQPPQALPGFWIFMYRVSPLTYIVDGVVATGLHGRPVQCSTSELNIFDPPAGLNCGTYLQSYLGSAAGQLLNTNATTQCQYCPLSNADQFLSTSAISWRTRWRNFGIGWAYIFFNLSAAVTLYYFFRVKKWGKPSLKIRFSKTVEWFYQAGYYAQLLLTGETKDRLFRQNDARLIQKLY